MFAAILKVFKESVGIVGIHMKIMSENMENPVIGISSVRLFFLHWITVLRFSYPWLLLYLSVCYQFLLSGP